ncbi:hypothetical protein DEJ49_34680 [Streptomyces venezuelae]|uniref:Uncharacterized protein n=1 Tax=Streptomyces venezuelae TaxID=54571 RepID=A0A5P2CRC3_STRVZ|nr:hypothetical protein [Streptomyces venezuelae]QES45456.1 hypothetical protein DEJ49_34680 [Streptomyces venezuelae]
MTSRESLRVAVALVAVSAVLLAAVTAPVPGTAQLLCGVLLGASVTAVAFALAGWGAVGRGVVRRSPVCRSVVGRRAGSGDF